MPRYALLFLFCLLTSVATAADLRIETRVYEADATEPSRESTTLFQDGVVYDFRPDDSRVTIYRSGVAGKPGRFVLIDTKRKVRTEITTDRIAAVMQKLGDWASQQDDPFLKFMADPQFDEKFDKETGELRLTSDQISYRLATIPTDHEEMKEPVRDFLDHFAQLQTLLDAGLPPAPRLRVNDALFRHGVMPVEVHVSTGRLTDAGDPDPGLWADHLTAWVLSKKDRQRIDEAIDQMASFEKVSNKAFRAGNERLAEKP